MKNFFLIFINLIICSFVFSATFNVNSVAQLQNALNSASSNSEDDTINILSGDYNVTNCITFWSDEDNSLTMNGIDFPIFNGNDSNAIFEIMTESSFGDIFISSLIIEHGHTDNAGVMYLETIDATITVDNCTFRDNTTNYICGGLNIYSQTAEITVSNCTFLRNSSPNTMGYPYGTAGGLFVQTEGEGAQITLINSTFEYNTAHRDAAGAMLYPMGLNSSVSVQDNTFEYNVAQEFGGGCWIRCPGGYSNIEYHGNILSHNSAETAGSGGGTYIELESGSVNISDNLHSNNNAAWQGGAIFINHNGGNMEMENNRFEDNNSEQSGGAANIYIDSGAISLHHNIFDTNESNDSGGGLCLSTTSASMNVFNNTFFSNSGSDGGDVYLYCDNSASSVNFYNNILFGSSLPALSYSGATNITARYCDIDGGSGEVWFGTGCINSNPLFVNSANDDFNLSWTNYPVDDATKSPCIDSGDPASLNDNDGTIADMGALYFNQAAINSPDNLIISINGNSLTLSWDSVSNATSYSIFSSNNPYGDFSLEQSGITETFLTLPINHSKRFFYVKAVR